MYTLYFDGCSKGNPGKGGSGAVLYENNVEIWAYSAFVGEKVTNNHAEYHGLLIGLEEVVKRNIRSLVVKGDSMLVIKQMRGECKVSSTNIRPFYEKAKEMVKRFDEIEFHHIYRNDNKRADTLSNEGIIGPSF